MCLAIITFKSYLNGVYNLKMLFVDMSSVDALYIGDVCRGLLCRNGYQFANKVLKLPIIAT